MYFSKKLMGNSFAAKAQMNDVLHQRIGYNSLTKDQNLTGMRFDPRITVNDGLVPREAYQEFDRVASERMRLDDGDAFLNVLMPNSKSVDIGTLVSRYRMPSDSGNAQTSMTGQTGVLFDQTENTYDGAIVPIHDAGFGRNFREKSAFTTSGIDLLVDDQRENVATVREQIADSFMDGQRDKSGNLIVVNKESWAGMRGDSRVAQVDLGPLGINFDFTDQTQSGEAIKAAFILVRDIARISNKCSADLDYYFPLEVLSNFERKFSNNYNSKTIDEELKGLRGVGEIYETNKLEGNELMGFPSSSNYVRPVVGMGLNTIAIPRLKYNDDYNFITSAAIGWQIRTDFEGRTCALYAQG